MTREINSRINVQGLSVVHLNSYKLIEVIAELVDNSVDSFIGNRMDGTLIVDIQFEPGEVVYRDNAFGFDSAAFDRAFQTHIQNQEFVTYGTYGVGMKHALLWLGKDTIIETKSLKDNCSYRTVYPKIIDGLVQDTLTLEENLSFDLGAFNTRFTICDARTYRYNEIELIDLKNSLGEIYKYHSNNLQISVNGELLNLSTKYDILNARYVGDYLKRGDTVCLDKVDSKEICWKFNFTDPITTTEGVISIV